MAAESGSDSADGPSFKLVVAARVDLKMSAGKLASQVGHAVQDAVRDASAGTAERLDSWERNGSRIVVLQVDNEEELHEIVAKAKSQGLPSYPQEDAGLTELEDGAWTVAALGPDESSRVDLVTGDLDVYVDPVVENLRRDLELVEVRKSLEFAEIRRRLQDAEVELAKLRQSAPKSPPEPLVLRSGERWLVLEVPPEVDLSSRPRVPEFMETWVWEGDPDILPRKWTDAVELSFQGQEVADAAKQPWKAAAFDREGTFFVTHRSETVGIAAALAGPTAEVGVIAGWGVNPAFRRRGVGFCLLRMCIDRHVELRRSRVICAVDQQQSPEAWRLLEREGFKVGPLTQS